MKNLLECKKIKKQIWAYLTGDIESDLLKARIEQHISKCASCRIEMGQSKASLTTLVEEASPLMKSMASEVVQKSYSARSSSRARSGLTRSIVIAIALLAAGMGWKQVAAVSSHPSKITVAGSKNSETVPVLQPVTTEPTADVPVGKLKGTEPLKPSLTTAPVEKPIVKAAPKTIIEEHTDSKFNGETKPQPAISPTLSAPVMPKYKPEKINKKLNQKQTHSKRVILKPLHVGLVDHNKASILSIAKKNHPNRVIRLHKKFSRQHIARHIHTKHQVTVFSPDGIEVGHVTLK